MSGVVEKGKYEFIYEKFSIVQFVTSPKACCFSNMIRNLFLMKGIVAQKSEFITEPLIIIPSFPSALFSKMFAIRAFQRYDDLKTKFFLDISSLNFGRQRIKL